MKYRLYVDEVGNPDLASSANPNHRFLSLTGVIVDLSHADSIIHPEMEALKRRYFRHHADEPVILHRKEMVNQKDAFEVLKDVAVRAPFDADLLGHLGRWDFTVITVCIDKKTHQETYTVWRYDPYHYCLAVLLERFVFFLNRRRAKGDVMAESRGGKEDMRLKASFEGLWKTGTEYVKPEQFQEALTSRQLKVKTKANNIAGLQLADLLAHPSRNEVLAENGLLERGLAEFAQKIVEILQRKYDRRGTAVYGKKMLP